MINTIRRFLMTRDPFLKPPKVSENLLEPLEKPVEVTEFWETDRCEFCDALMGGYIAGKDHRHINIRDGHYCPVCGKPETPL